MATDFDIIIVGGGLVGSCLGYALQHLPLKIGIIEAQQHSQQPTANKDGRAIALTYGSQQYLQQLDLWQDLAPFATPIAQVHTSDKGHFGMTRFTAAQYHIPALGYVIPISHLQPHLMQAAAKSAALISIAPAEVCALVKIDKQWRLTVKTPTGEQTLSTKLVIAADGTKSTIRALQKIPVVEHDYQQTAIISNVQLQRPHANIAYERFTKEGAIALLPRADNQSTLVWTLATSKATELLSLDKHLFLQRLQQEFGYRAGRFISLGHFAAHPLKLIYTEQPANSDIVFIGNAAQTVHPIAAQGFNLGLRDVSVLAQMITTLVKEHKLAELAQVNHTFTKSRQSDQQRVIQFTNAVIKIFASDFLPLTLSRSLALTSLEVIPALKRRFVRAALGIIKV